MKVSRFGNNANCKPNQVICLICGILLIGLSFTMQYSYIPVSEFWKQIPPNELDPISELERSINAKQWQLIYDAILILGVIWVSSATSIWMNNCPNKKCGCDEKKK